MLYLGCLDVLRLNLKTLDDMVVLLVILFFVVCVVVCILSLWHSQDAEINDNVRNILEHSSANKTICIEVDGKRIMLREDFIEKEWNKTDEKGIPVRGVYESPIHFVNRVKKYRDKMRKQKEIDNSREKSKAKSDYEADEILKKYLGN